MTKDEAIELVASGKYTEAYEAFQELYKVSNDLLIKYYIVMIDFHEFAKKTSEEYYIDFKELLALPKRYHVSIYIPLITICLDLQKYDEIYQYCQAVYNENASNAYIDVAYAKALLHYKNDYEGAIQYANKSLNDDESIEQVKHFAFEIKIVSLIELQKFDEAEQVINQMYLSLNDKEFVQLEELRVNYYLNKPKEVIEALYEGVIFRPNMVKEAYPIMLSYYVDNNYFDDALKFIDSVLDMLYGEENIDYVYDLKTKKAMLYRMLSRREEAIKVLESLIPTNQHLNEIYYYLGEFNYELHTRTSLTIAIDYYKKAISEEENPVFYNCLGDAYDHLGKYDELYKLIPKCMEFEDSSYYSYFLYRCFLKKGEFDRALIELKNAFYNDEIRQIKYEIALSLVSKNPRISLTKDEESIIYYREVANGIWNGIYNVKGDRNLALEYAKKAYEEDAFPYTMSMYASIIQDADPEKAFAIFEEGAKMFFLDDDLDDKCVGHYLYCLIFGVGTKKQIDKAMDLIKDAIIISESDISENVLFIQAYLSLTSKKSLKKIYDLLLNLNTRRYNIGKYYYLIRLGYELNIDVTSYVTAYQEACRRGPKAEAAHYNEDTLIPYMIN